MSVFFRRFLRLAVGLLLNLVFACASLVPRCRTRWIFGAWNGVKFIDNPKYVFLHVLDHLPTVNATWITRSRLLADELRAKGFPAEYAGSLRGIWAQLRAGVVVFTHSVEWDLWAPLIARRVLRVQMWHGMPIKHIGYDDARDISTGRVRWITLLYPYRDDRVDLVTAAGLADQACYRSAFNVNPRAVVLTGYARNDALLRSIRSVTHSTKESLQVIYMPTLRGKPDTDFLLFETTKFDFSVNDGVCEKLGISLWIKLHPVQTLRQQDLLAISECKHIHLYKEQGDVYESIGQFDVLITDFSGIYFDFLITGRPIIMAPLDMRDYLFKDRSLYYPYEDICPDEPCTSWPQVFDQLGALRRKDTIPSAKYRDLQTRFHAYLDDKSSERVASTILSIALGISSGPRL